MLHFKERGIPSGLREYFEVALSQDSVEVSVSFDQRLEETKAEELENQGIRFKRENGELREYISTYKDKTFYHYYAQVTWEQICILVDDPSVVSSGIETYSRLPARYASPGTPSSQR